MFVCRSDVMPKDGMKRIINDGIATLYKYDIAP